MNNIKTFWQFSRPHTIIGSICSIVTLYLLAATEYGKYDSSLLVLTLVASLACNIFIVGLNQVIDIEVDKINKPYLPLASGTMSKNTAWQIIITCCIISIVVAFFSSLILGLLIVIIMLLGIAYSVPPIQLKKHHLPAAIAITLVRGVLVNLGMFIHFKSVLTQGSLNVDATLPPYLYTLTIFVIAFSIAIAWFKDLPDTEGDAQFRFKTLSILYSRKTALVAGSILVIIAYLYCIFWTIDTGQVLMLYAHVLLLLLFIANIITVKLNNPKTIKSFYLRFWVFFFAEYILFAVWALR